LRTATTRSDFRGSKRSR